MRSEEELTHLFSEYFGDRLSAFEIETLVRDVRASVQDRRARTIVTDRAVTSSSAQAPAWKPQFAF